ncbi:MAG: hypothetical protein HN441_02030 [Candidatus Thioglobus sp.]|nr:hypothetical protein [Candidatus Thioglobus sp.]
MIDTPSKTGLRILDFLPLLQRVTLITSALLYQLSYSGMCGAFYCLRSPMATGD